MKKNSAKWWGPFDLAENQPRYWEIGPLLLGIERQIHEWRIASNSSADPDKSNITVAAENCPGFDKDSLEFRRFIFQRTDSKITLTPVLANRSQVSHTEIPFYVSPDQHATIYVSSPLWVKIAVGQNQAVLDEIPTLLQSDTWYGPNTREGELCFSSKTFCRTNLEDLPVRSNRILTPIKIYNHTKQSLLIGQLSIPLPFLSVFVDNNGAFFTEEIIVKSEADLTQSIKQNKGPPSIAQSATMLSAPRLPLKAHNFINLFYSLLAE